MAVAFQMSMNIAVLGYSLAMLAFFSLIVLLLTSWRKQLNAKALIFSCLLTIGWSATLAWQSGWATHFSVISDVTEVLRNAGWTGFLLLLMGFFQKPKSLSGPRLNSVVVAIGIFYLVILLATLARNTEQHFVVAEIVVMASTVGRLASAVLGLLLVEQLYRNTPVEERWGIKFACMGMGGLFAYDFYMYSDAMLFRHVNIEIWSARGVVNALTVPLIAMSASRNPKWSLGFTVSRRIAFHSVSLFGAAIYLLAMASAGYYLRYFGGRWGTVIQVAFLFGALILLGCILFSGVFRSWLRVVISKHFFNYTYDYREEWLRFTRILSEDGPDLGVRVVQALAKLVESPGGALFVTRESGQSGHCERLANWNMSLMSQSDPANLSLCRFLEQKQWVIDLKEYADNPTRYTNVALPEWLCNFSKAWLVIPLSLHGKLLGFVVLAQPRSALNLNWEVIDLLKIAGSQAASYLAQQESAHALMVARQFESFNRMSTFVVHDLKNLISQLSLLMSNAEKHKHNPEFQKDMLATIDHSVQKMKLLLQKLSRKDAIETYIPLNIDALLQQIIQSKSRAEPRPTLEIGDPGLVVMADWERLERVIGHIIQNAIEATSKAGKVVVSVAKVDERVAISINDTGRGMSKEFIRDRLFKPFESTKSAGMGIGVFESHEYINELGGQLTVISQESIGTNFLMMLPFHKDTTKPIALLQEEASESK
ncbi:PEP-CTERM system histidine kinase PrsK [Glaciimonas sp. Gout2]|uniref:XrtA/PEP-CTERM system histidine kinase PrsK n=1 Tax=unclassified Glaciimonas TaxID=2644401 RepID=UPI002B229D02|nr:MULTISPECIES: XrtA/PEP-CTERM system histidine kinase PrsK [unclassified Glaciimonas]MEB0012000.1 PEP-CTERM system histidine kinase PrsK [Glaciimonas sp. Cout2]MEB0084547.1 PEP-CTERM system histidine kinase PrsK [Glaciimonas sp. Gout2]